MDRLLRSISHLYLVQLDVESSYVGKSKAVNLHSIRCPEHTVRGLVGYSHCGRTRASDATFNCPRTLAITATVAVTAALAITITITVVAITRRATQSLSINWRKR